MGKDVWFYSFTLEPDKDSPEVLAEYAKRFGVGPGWLFLTGNPEDLETLRQNLGFAWSDPVLDADLTNHVGTVKMGLLGPRRTGSPRSRPTRWPASGNPSFAGGGSTPTPKWRKPNSTRACEG